MENVRRSPELRTASVTAAPAGPPAAGPSSHPRGPVLRARAALDGLLTARNLRYALFSIAIFSLLWFFRSSTFRGDGDMIARFIQGHLWYYERELLLHFLLVLAHPILSPWHWNGMQILNLYSCIAGVVFLLLLLRLTRDWLGHPLPGFCFFIASGLTILFAGHTEYYGPTAAAALLFFERAFRCLRGESPLRHALWTYALFASFHLIAFFTFPALLYLLWRGRTAPGFWRELAWGLPPLAALIFILGWNPASPRTYAELIGPHICPLAPRAGPGISVPLFSWYHLKGWIYWQAKACLPGLPLVALLVNPGIRSRLHWRQFHTFLAISSAGLLLFSLLWHPDLGIWRDWDLFSMTVLPHSLLALSAWHASRGLLRKAVWLLLLPTAVWTWSHIVRDAKLGHRGRGTVVVQGINGKYVQINVDGHLVGPVTHNVLEGTRRIHIVNLTDRDAWRGFAEVRPSETTVLEYQVGQPDHPDYDRVFREAHAPPKE